MVCIKNTFLLFLLCAGLALKGLAQVEATVGLTAYSDINPTFSFKTENYSSDHINHIHNEYDDSGFKLININAGTVTADGDKILSNYPTAIPDSFAITLCSGSSIRITAATDSGVTYNWYNAPIGGSSLYTGTTFTTPILNTTTTYYVDETYSDGCTSRRTPATIIILPLPNAPVVSGTTICRDSSTILTATSSIGTYNWYSAASGGNLIATGASFVTPALTATTTYYVDATSASGCASLRTPVKVTVIPPADAAFHYTSGAFCKSEPDPIPVTNSSSVGTFSSIPTGLIFANSGTGEIDLQKSLSGTYTIRNDIKGLIDCASTFATGTVSIYPDPIVNVGSDLYVLLGENAVLKPFVNDSSLKYTWTPNLYLNDNTLKNPTLTGTQDITYTLTAIGAGGCTAEDQVFVKVLKPLIIPNTFTPNSDGINDTWVITELGNYPNATVQIFNRNGMQIFYSHGYVNPWDGNYNGKPLDVGTYYYIINLNIYGKLTSGNVTVIR